MDEFNEEVCKIYKNIDEQIEYLKMFKKMRHHQQVWVDINQIV